MKAVCEIVKIDVCDVVTTSGGSGWDPSKCPDQIELTGI